MFLLLFFVLLHAEICYFERNFLNLFFGLCVEG